MQRMTDEWIRFLARTIIQTGIAIHFVVVYIDR
jgi:hypothetical protein